MRIVRRASTVAASRDVQFSAIGWTADNGFTRAAVPAGVSQHHPKCSHSQMLRPESDIPDKSSLPYGQRYRPLALGERRHVDPPFTCER